MRRRARPTCWCPAARRAAAAVGTCDVAENLQRQQRSVSGGRARRERYDLPRVGRRLRRYGELHRHERRLPGGRFVGSGTQCRASVSSCDPAEQCIGRIGAVSERRRPQDGDADGVCDASDPVHQPRQGLGTSSCCRSRRWCSRRSTPTRSRARYSVAARRVRPAGGARVREVSPAGHRRTPRAAQCSRRNRARRHASGGAYGGNRNARLEAQQLRHHVDLSRQDHRRDPVERARRHLAAADPRSQQADAAAR